MILSIQDWFLQKKNSGFFPCLHGWVYKCELAPNSYCVTESHLLTNKTKMLSKNKQQLIIAVLTTASQRLCCKYKNITLDCCKHHMMSCDV